MATSKKAPAKKAAVKTAKKAVAPVKRPSTRRAAAPKPEVVKPARRYTRKAKAATAATDPQVSTATEAAAPSPAEILQEVLGTAMEQLGLQEENKAQPKTLQEQLVEIEVLDLRANSIADRATIVKMLEDHDYLIATNLKQPVSEAVDLWARAEVIVLQHQNKLLHFCTWDEHKFSGSIARVTGIKQHTHFSITEPSNDVPSTMTIGDAVYARVA